METSRYYMRMYCLPILLWPLFLAVLLLLIPVIVIVYIIRTVEYSIYCTLYGAKLMPYGDVVWTMGTPQNDLTINSCLIVDGVLPLETFRTLINECLINSKDEKGTFLYWKVTKRILPGYINYYWIDEDKFDIKDHVYELLSRENAIMSKEDLKNTISRHRSAELSIKRNASPWEFLLIPYVEDGKNKTVILCRLSHAIADGSALAYFLTNRVAQFQYQCREETILKFSQGPGIVSSIDKFLLTLKGAWTLPVVQLGFLFSSMDDNILHFNNRGVSPSGNKQLTWTNPVDLALVKSIKNKLNTTVNDVLLGCLAMSINDYFAEMSYQRPSEVTVVFPFDIRSSPDEAKHFQNKVAMIILRLPTKSTDLLASIKTVKERMDLLKTSGEPIASLFCWKLLSFILPRCVSKRFIFSTINKTTGSLSNLAGPQQTMTIGGYPLDMVTFWPPLTNNQSFGTGFCSYDGFIWMAVEMDHCISENPQRICSIFEENIDKLNYITNDTFT